MKKDIYLKALKVEKNEVLHLLKTGQISNYIFGELQEIFNHSESNLSSDLNKRRF